MYQFSDYIQIIIPQTIYFLGRLTDPESSIVSTSKCVEIERSDLIKSTHIQTLPVIGKKNLVNKFPQTSLQ